MLTWLIFPDLVGQLLQRSLGNVAVERDRDHLVPGLDLGDDRLFRLLRKRDDGVHFGLHIVEHFRGVGVFLHFDQRRADAFDRGRGHALDTFDARDRLLDAHAHPLLHVIGGGPPIRNGDVDHVQAELGER